MITRHIKRNKDPASPSYKSHAARRRDHLYRREDAPLALRRQRNLPAAPKLISRASQYFGSQIFLLTVEGPKVPLSRGLFGFVALRCYAEECAFSLSTQALYKTTSGTSLSTSESNRRTAQPERRPEGQDASELLCGAYHPLSLCARLVLCMTGVLELDLT